MVTKKPLDLVGRITEVNKGQGVAKIEYRSWNAEYTENEIREAYVSKALLDQLAIEGVGKWVRFRINDASTLIVDDLEPLEDSG